MAMMPPAGYAIAMTPKMAPKLCPPKTSENAAERMAIVAPIPNP